MDFSAFMQQLGFDPAAVASQAIASQAVGGATEVQADSQVDKPDGVSWPEIDPAIAEEIQSASISVGASSIITDEDQSFSAGGSSDLPQAASDRSSQTQQAPVVPVRREPPYVRQLFTEVYVTRVKKLIARPMAYVTFTSPEIAQIVHMTPPSAVGGVPILPPRQHETDPNSLVVRWQEGFDLPQQVLVQDFAALAAAYTGQGIVTGVKKLVGKPMAFVTFFSPTLTQAVLAQPPSAVAGTAVLPPRQHETDANAIVLRWHPSSDVAVADIAAHFDSFFESQVGQPLLIRPGPQVMPKAVGMPMLANAAFSGSLGGNANVGLAARANLGLAASSNARLAARGGHMAMPGMMQLQAAAQLRQGAAQMQAAAQMRQASLISSNVVPPLKRTAAALPPGMGHDPLSSPLAGPGAGPLQAMWMSKRQRLLEGNAQT